MNRLVAPSLTSFLGLLLFVACGGKSTQEAPEPADASLESSTGNAFAGREPKEHRASASACPTERGAVLLVFGMRFSSLLGFSRLRKGAQILAEPIEVLLPLRPSLADPSFGQAQCLGLDPTGADAADLHRSHEPGTFEHGQMLHDGR